MYITSVQSLNLIESELAVKIQLADMPFWHLCDLGLWITNFGMKVVCETQMEVIITLNLKDLGHIVSEKKPTFMFFAK